MSCLCRRPGGRWRARWLPLPSPGRLRPTTRRHSCSCGWAASTGASAVDPWSGHRSPPKVVSTRLLHVCAVENSSSRICSKLPRLVGGSPACGHRWPKTALLSSRYDRHAHLSHWCAGSSAASGGRSGVMRTRTGWRPLLYPAPRSRPPLRGWATSTAMWRATRQGRGGATSGRWRWTRCKAAQVCAEPWLPVWQMT